MNTRAVNRKVEKEDEYIGRGSIWGNPFTHKEGTLAEFKVNSRDEAVNCFKDWILKKPELLKELWKLQGKKLGCYCKPAKCHGDVLVELINRMNELVIIKNGDLLLSDCTVIAHQANCYKTMGAGIALQIKRKYPIAYERDCELDLSPQNRLGKCSSARTSDGKIVVNMYGQLRYGRDKRYTDYEALFSCLGSLFNGCDILENKGEKIKIGLPYKMGCMNAGGDWNIVLGMIQGYALMYNREVYIYK